MRPSDEGNLRGHSFSTAGPGPAFRGLSSLSADALLAEISASESRLATGTLDLDVAVSSSPALPLSASRDNQTDGSLTALAVAPFLDLLETELERVAGSVASQLGGAEATARTLHASAERALATGRADHDPSTTSNDGNAGRTQRLTGEAERLRGEASDLGAAFLNLKFFAFKSATEFRRIAGEADQRLGTTCHEMVNRRLLLPPWSSIVTGDSIVALLSDVYGTARAMEKEGAVTEGGADSKWVAPNSFVRKTNKYWVDEERLSEVMLACVAEVPLLVYGQKGCVAPKKRVQLAGTSSTGTEVGTWDGLATPINNIYFDTNSMALYAERIVREEDARLLRVRWYGNERPQGDEVLFLELKTHHMKWVNMKSVKRRVSICERDMAALLDTTNNTNAEWTEERAGEIVARASPALKADKRDEAVALLLECRELIARLGLRPCVRTRYLRTAFQSAESNALRVTVDRCVTMIDERGASPGAWCLPEGSAIHVRSQVFKLPCDVVEVKLIGEEIPSFVDDLERRGVITDGHKFSKYLTGGAAFNCDRVNMMPYWADLPPFKSIFEGHHCSNYAVAPSCTNEVGATVGDSGPEKSTPTNYVSWIGSQNTREAAASLPVVPMAEGPEGRDKDDGHYFGALLGMRRRRSKERQAQTFAPKRPVKVEPKSYFANERTFIQWITAAILMVTLSIILFEFGRSDAAVMGMVLCSLGMAMSVYALVMYYRRVQLMEHRKTYGYVDHIGPAILTGAILLGISAMLYFHFRESGGNGAAALASPAAPAALASAPGQCDPLGTSGMPALEYQPSDALVDNARGVLLVPSLDLITALPLHPSSSSEEVQIVAEVAGEDFEALTYVGDIIYAVSEGSEVSELFAFKWIGSGMILAMVDSWKIPSSGVEGMAYVPDDRSGVGKLFIASDRSKLGVASNDVGRIDVYDVPYFPGMTTTTNAKTLSPTRRLNADLMFHGLEDTTISSMRYFEGALYILHSNARVVRSWDLDSGSMRAEFSLPAVGGGFDKQWEGIDLLRMAPDSVSSSESGRKVDGATHLRASSGTSQLKLYLALDTPPQIWSIEVSEAKSGGWKFPPCFTGLSVKK